MANKVIIFEDRCKGCALCTTACPKNILVMGKQMNAKGYYPVTVTDQEQCIACVMCARMCPDCAIQIEK
ncbi:MAG: 4Fe-4S binding protein [Negativicutes bacterium]|nr:4Fe-4S binding protein [Negativicutes bacterium]